MFDLKVYGVEHVPPRGGVLIASNHQSYLDPVLMGVKLPRPLSYMGKSELFENRFFSWLIRNLNAFPVRQGEGDVGAVKETIRRLQEGQFAPLGACMRECVVHVVVPGVQRRIAADVPYQPQFLEVADVREVPDERRLKRRHLA
jgi:1-acyl-sn-glycerol-3-phosphate acyltransferase